MLRISIKQLQAEYIPGHIHAKGCMTTEKDVRLRYEPEQPITSQNKSQTSGA